MNELIAFDHRIFRLINQEWANPALDAVMPVVTDLHKNTWFLGLVLPALLIWLFYKQHRRGILILASITILLALVDGFNYRVLKALAERSRPEFSGVGATVRSISHTGPSFPSNHAANMGALMIFLSFVFPNGAKYFMTIALLIAYSRVYVGVHFPADVLAGLMVGVLFGITIYRFVFKRLDEGPWFRPPIVVRRKN